MRPAKLNAEWRGALATIDCAPGLRAHPYESYIGQMLWPVPRTATQSGGQSVLGLAAIWVKRGLTIAI